jgi:outer membrane protein assembly factor BamB
MRFIFACFVVLLLGSFACHVARPLAFATDSDSAKAEKLACGFLGTAEHTANYHVAGLNHAAEIRWCLQTDGPVRSSPVIVDSVIYVGSNDGYLRAVDPRSGEERWRYRTRGAVTSSPAVANNAVYVASRDCFLHSVRADDGKPRWRFRMGEELPFAGVYDYLLSSPVVAGERVYVGGGDGYVHAVSASDGREIWKFKTAGRVRSSPAYAQGVVYVGSMDGYLYALDGDNGKLLWKFATEGSSFDPDKISFDRISIISSPAIGKALVLIGSRDGHLYAVDRATGKQQWSVDHKMSWVVASPALTDELVLIGTGDAEVFQAVEIGTGREKWRFNAKARIFASGTIAEDVVYVAAQDGTFHALSITTGAELWRLRLPAPISSTPAVADGMLFVGCDDGCLYGLGSRVTPARPQGLAKKAVFWDSKGKSLFFRGVKQVHDYFTAAGYEELGPADLETFLTARIKDRARSVIVFASEVLPALYYEDKGMAILRDYLGSGGKMVWLGLPPLLFKVDANGKPSTLDQTRAERLLNVHFGNLQDEDMSASVTLDGYRWGLRKWSLTKLAIDPKEVSTVLARDEYGRAAAWVKSYDPAVPGAGFVRLWGRREPCPNLDEVKAAAEYGLE